MNRVPRVLFLSSSFLLVMVVLVFVFVTPAAIAQEVPTEQDSHYQTPVRGQLVADAASRLRQDSGGAVSITFNDATGVARFVRVTEPGALVPDQGGNGTRGQAPQAMAAAFFADYGQVFGINNPSTELKLVESGGSSPGLNRLTFQQSYQGVDVFGAVLKVTFNHMNQITAVNGAFVPDLNVSTTPGISLSNAASKAIAAVQAQYGLQQVSTDLSAVANKLVIFRSGLVRGILGTNHLAYEVEVANGPVSIREFVFVDAHSGKIINQFSGIHSGLDRKISEATLANVVWQDSAGNPDPITAGWAGGSAQQVTDWQNEIDGARETYNLFASMAGRDSYDGAGATMRTVNNDPSIFCPNANWNGISTNYCSDVTGDDTVAHEWGHAYTEYTNDLIYQWQSGALNESYSDIWGEVVDLLNGRGTDSPGTLRTAGSCSVYGAGSPKNDNTYRWLSGEDDPAFNGAIRDLWNPVCYNDPGKVSDSQYVCSTSDGGGVHSNSGVPNHAFALMVDGGSYNGQTITGIGLTKAAHLHWEAQNTLTPSSNFQDHAQALQNACTTLTGVNLNALSTSANSAGASGEMITAGDCQEVAKVIAAVELDQEPSQCNFQTMLDPNAPALCAAGETVDTFLSEDFEGANGALPAGWFAGTRSVVSPSTFDTPDWAVVSNLPAGAPAGSSNAAFVADLIIGNCGADDESGVLYMDSPEVIVPAGGSARLAFDHWVATETGWDGGNLKVSVNGGAFQLVPSSAFGFNPYNSSLSSWFQGNTNPLEGEAAFTGTDGGSVGGSWGQSQVDLSNFAGPGDSVVLRYDFGIDGCNGLVGWYVDNVQAYTCSVPTSGDLVVSNISVSKVSQGPWDSAQATINVETEAGAPAAGASVEGEFTGPTSGIALGTTDGNGVVVLNSPREKNVSGEWTFCVTAITLSGWSYNPASADCGSTGAPVPTGAISGTVVDSDTGSFIAGASIETDSGQSTSTDGNGFYTLANVSTGSRTVSASASGFQSDSQVTSVTDGGTSVVNFSLVPAVPGAAPTVATCSPSSGTNNDRLLVSVTGSGYASGASADFGADVAVQSVSVVSDTQLDVQIKVHRRAELGPRDVTVTNLDGGTGTGTGCFTVN